MYMKVVLDSFNMIRHYNIDRELDDNERKRYRAKIDMESTTRSLESPTISYAFSQDGWIFEWSIIVDNHFPELDMAEDILYKSAKKFIPWLKNIHMEYLEDILKDAEKRNK